MFYCSIPVNRDTTIQAGITTSNVFTHCVHCGKKISVDLEKFAADTGGLRLDSGMFCSKQCCLAYSLTHGLAGMDNMYVDYGCSSNED